MPASKDIRERQAARSRTDLPGSDEGYGSLAADARVHSAPDWERPVERGSYELPAALRRARSAV
jgi:hypothetical protein